MRPLDGLRSLAGSADVLLCDVFGTIHDAERAFPAAIEALTRFREAGGFVMLLSNAAAPAPVLARALAELGVHESCCDAILTSADVARGMLVERMARRVHHIGAVREECLFAGLPVALCSVAEAELVVCTGCPEGPLPEAALRQALARGLDMLCTNPDTELVAGARTLRFAGLVADRYAALGGTVVATGKPGAAIYGEAMARVAAMRGGAVAGAVAPERVLAIGDTAHLDVAGAVAAGYRALWIGEGADAPHGAARMPALAW